MRLASRAKQCCGSCRDGGPCCDSKPAKNSAAFAKRRGLWLPRRAIDIPQSLLRHPTGEQWGGFWRPWLPQRRLSLYREFDLGCLPCCGCCNCASIATTISATLGTSGAVPGLDGVAVTLTKDGGGSSTHATWSFSGAISCGDTFSFTFTCDTLGVECVAEDPMSNDSLTWSSTAILGPGAISGPLSSPPTTQCPISGRWSQTNSGYSGACGSSFTPYTLTVDISE